MAIRSPKAYRLSNVVWGCGLPHQSADWFAMTSFLYIFLFFFISILKFCLQRGVLFQHLGGIGGPLGVQPGGKLTVLHSEDLGA